LKNAAKPEFCLSFIKAAIEDLAMKMIEAIRQPSKQKTLAVSFGIILTIGVLWYVNCTLDTGQFEHLPKTAWLASYSNNIVQSTGPNSAGDNISAVLYLPSNTRTP
jgi:hypothetical protein